jgi:hypothetical protein
MQCKEPLCKFSCAFPSPWTVHLAMAQLLCRECVFCLQTYSSRDGESYNSFCTLTAWIIYVHQGAQFFTFQNRYFQAHSSDGKATDNEFFFRWIIETHVLDN